MISYQLRFATDGIGQEKRIEFDALDASDALLIAHREAPHRAAELWQGDQKLCTLRRRQASGGDLWQIS